MLVQKPLFALFLTLLAMLVSCSDAPKTPDPVPNAIPEKEQQLRNDVNLYPDSMELRENLIEYYHKNEDYDTAQMEVDKALAKDSLNHHLWDIKATLYYEDEDTLRSIHAFEKAVSIRPMPEYLISLATLYALTHDARAMELSNALLIDKKTNAEKQAYFIKGLYYAYSATPAKSLPFFDQVLALDYNFMDAYREKGIVLYNMGNFAEAEKVFTRAVTLQHLFDEGYFWLGRCKEKLNDIPAAIENYQLAVKTAEMQQGNNQDAIDALARLQKNDH